MPQKSAGLLMFRFNQGQPEVFLVHPGGPLWSKKDLGAWSIPKGLYEEEDPLQAARREFQEETGFRSEGRFIPLGSQKQSSGKVITAWAVEGDCNADAIRSNTFSIQWPPKSGRQQSFPEVDRAGWFSIETAKKKIVKGQVPFIQALVRILSDGTDAG